MNENDSEVIAAIVENFGFIFTENMADADLVIINTCAVRKKPEDKVTSLLGKLSILKKERHSLKIAVGGCMSQQQDFAQQLKKRFPGVDLIFGTHALTKLPDLIKQIFTDKRTVIDIEEHNRVHEGLPSRPKNTFHAWVPVIYGCDNFCAYCVVPYVRGRERSRELESIIKEVHELVSSGYKEVTLLGQNVNSYGNDLYGPESFAKLLTCLDQIDGLARIRFMTSNPKDLSNEVIAVIRDSRKICEHIHLPVQSGSNRILELMNRQYTREYYLNLVNKIRSEVPGISITTDILVGFPGENENDFLDTLELLQEIKFDNAFAFIYSKRMNTKAASLEDHISYKEKEERLSRINAVQQPISKMINERLKGNTCEILVEGRSKNNEQMLTGRTRSNKLVHFASSCHLEGQLLNVKIEKALTWNLVGSLQDGEK